MNNDIHFFLTEDELKSINENALNANLSTVDHIKKCALKPSIESLDLSFFTNHTQNLAQFRKVIDEFTNSIATRGNYTQEEMDAFISMMRSVVKNNTDVVNRMINLLHSLPKERLAFVNDNAELYDG